MKTTMLSSNAKYLFVGMACVIAYCLPYIILGEDAYIPAGDFLDSTIGHLRNIMANNSFFNLGATIPVMYGMPRSGIAYTSPFEIKALLCLALPIYWGIVTNIILVKTCAFAGMYLLLVRTKIVGQRWIALFTALLFSFVPFYIDYGITIAGIPLICWAIINLKCKEKIPFSLAVSAFYGFYSSMAMGGFAVCLLLFIVIIILWIKEGHINLPMFSALALIVMAYILIDNHLIYDYLFNPNFASHRSARINSMSFFKSRLHYIATLVWKNSPPHYGRCIIVEIIIGFVLTTIAYRKTEKHLVKYLIAFVILYAIIAVSYLLYFLPVVFFKSFDFSRVSALYPSAIFILLAVTVDVLYRHKKIVFTCMLFMLTFVGIELETTNSNWTPRDHFTNIQLLAGNRENIEFPTFRQFYDTELFCHIANDIGAKQDYSTKVVSIALLPAVAEFNGFYCLDGYFNNYSIDYMKEIYEVNRNELSKNADLDLAFAHGHNKNFIISTETGISNFHYSKSDTTVIHNLETNISKLRDMGCQFIFSAVEISNHADIGLTHIGDYTSDKSFWNIRVYKL